MPEFRNLPRALQWIITFGLLGSVSVLQYCGGQFFEGWKQPYLQSASYPMYEDCSRYLQVANYMPLRCVPPQYVIKTSYYSMRYGLRDFPRGDKGWLRVGDNAVRIGQCTSSCRVNEIVPNVFGRGGYPGK